MERQTVCMDKEAVIKAREYARSKGLKIEYFLTEAVKHWIAYNKDLDAKSKK